MYKLFYKCEVDLLFKNKLVSFSTWTGKNEKNHMIIS